MDGAYTLALKTKTSQIAHLGLFVFAKATDANRGCFETKVFDLLIKKIKRSKKPLDFWFKTVSVNSFNAPVLLQFPLKRREE